jgi:NTP pyrophosphatase (non-canonical NTP hydrolase)
MQSPAVATVKHVADNRVRDELRTFVSERDWAQFHSPENLAKSVAIESGELLECFQWGSDFDTDRVKDELADVLTYCYLLADRLGVDPHAIMLEKLARTRAKYPVESARGRSTKYDQL